MDDLALIGIVVSYQGLKQHLGAHICWPIYAELCFTELEVREPGDREFRRGAPGYGRSDCGTRRREVSKYPPATPASAQQSYASVDWADFVASLKKKRRAAKLPPNFAGHSHDQR